MVKVRLVLPRPPENRTTKISPFIAIHRTAGLILLLFQLFQSASDGTNDMGQEGFVSLADVSLVKAEATMPGASAAISFRCLNLSMARPELARLQQAFMRVIIFAGFFLRESWAS